MSVVNGESGFTQYNKLNLTDKLLVQGVPVGGSAAAQPLAGYRIGTIGTSLVSNNNGAAISETNPKVKSFTRGWGPWANVLSHGRFEDVVWYDATVYLGWEPSGDAGTSRGFMGLNAGVAGQKIDDILARKEFLVENIDCDIVILDPGTNDMGSTAKEIIQSKREELCQYYADAGKLVILFPILARDITSWPADGIQRSSANWINNQSRLFCIKTPGVFYFDWNIPWIDKSTANSIPKTGYSSDGIHFDALGGFFVGKALVEFLDSILPPVTPRVWSRDDVYDAIENPLGNLHTNTFALGTTGLLGTAATGEVMDDHKLERSVGSVVTVVGSKEVDADGSGKQVLTFTLGGTELETFYLRTSPADISHDLGGKFVRASFTVEVEDGDAITEIVCYLEDSQAANGILSVGMESVSDAPIAVGENWSGTIITPALELQTDSTSVRWRVVVTLDGAGPGTPVVKVGNIEIRPIEDPKIALNFIPPAT